MILGCLCVHECPLFPIPHLVSCSGTHVKSLHSASCLEPSQTRKRPRIEHSASRHKTASHFLDTGNGTLFATTQGTYLLQTPCVLGCFVGLSAPGALVCRFPGALLAACRIMSVTHVGSGRVGVLAWPSARRNYCAVGSGRASVLAWRRHRMAGPRCARLVSGTFLSLRARASVHEAIRPFRPWPCEPFP